jgi:protein-S-isoprenylcysteine O-methyltransferase Ste14
MSYAPSYSKIARRIRVPLGFVVAVLFVWLSRPTWMSLGAGAAVSLLGIWIRALAAGHVRKNAELTTTGPYSYTRNPLYLGSIVIAVGFAIAARAWTSPAYVIGIALAVMFAAIYVPVIRSEEAFLRTTFAGFDDYCRHVPRLLPRMTSAYPEQRTEWSAAQYQKHREYNALIGSLLLWGVLVAKIVIQNT